ncbi:MAG: hypothetical protein RLZZ272_741 [Actinomycetota bacterium]
MSAPRVRATEVLVPVVAFARALRATGVDAGPDRVRAFVEALDRLDATRASDVFWAGRVTLCARRDDLAPYDRVFAAFFAGRAPAAVPPTPTSVEFVALAAADPSASRAGATTQEEEVGVALRRASASERLRHRDVADLDPDERRELEALLALFRLPGERRRTRRLVTARRGAIDPRRTVRAMLEAGGEPGRLRRRRPRHLPRRVVLLVDVSGSMGVYADVLLRFAHAAVRRRGATTEVFALGTRLTRVTAELAHRDPDTALRAVGAAVSDWGGGTRLAETLGRFLDLHGQRGTARGAVVVVLSDGWETGDAEELGRRMARLARLAHRIVWANPRAGRPGFAPIAAGMAAALPHCDRLVEGHSLAALEHLAAIVVGEADALARSA